MRDVSNKLNLEHAVDHQFTRVATQRRLRELRLQRNVRHVLIRGSWTIILNLRFRSLNAGDSVMHVLFVHQNFPAQFGLIARRLIADHRARCTFVSQKPAGLVAGIELIQYQPLGGATQHNDYCTRSFENAIAHARGVYETLKKRQDIQPDLIVAHSGFGSSLFLSELYSCPIINYFEYFYHTQNSDMDFRPEFSGPELSRLRARARNAMLLLDLENCHAGYSPTHWQHSRLPREFRAKVEVIFDGIDTELWQRHTRVPRKIARHTIPEETRVVTYVSRGFESMRGFDLFMKFARRICAMRSDVIFLVVGEDRVCYGGDEQITGSKSFKQWVLEQGNFDLTRIHFLGRLHPEELARLLSFSDLHVYWTVPFVLSWSLMNALSCETVVLASRTAPVEEMVTHHQNGLLADFADTDEFVRLANEVLDDPKPFEQLGARARRLILDSYSLDVCLPKMMDLYERCLETDDAT